MADDLEELNGVGPATADKLRDGGYNSFEAIAVASGGDLSSKADIGENSAQKVIQSAREEADIGGFELGTTIADRRNKIGKLKMLIPEVDKLLGGGVETQNITEFYGEFGAGKSQITHQLSVNVQLPEEHGGLHGSAVFIDTEDTFRPERVAEMVRGLPMEPLGAALEEDGLDYSPQDLKDCDVTDEDGRRIDNPVWELADKFLDRIKVAKAHNTDHQMLLAEKAQEIAEDLSETDYPMRAVMIDSLTAHFRAEFVGRGELAQRQQKLNKHMHDILQLADLYNSCAIVTNQVSSNPDSYFGDPTQPIGGNIIGHTSNFRIYLRNSKNNKRVVKLVNSPNLEEGESVLRVSNEGVKPE
jgi:DNA repair protein RadA